MKKINIQINQAKIMSFSVEMEEKYPEVSATIGLFSGEKKISSFSLRTQNYYSDSIKFDLPIEMIDPIKAIAKKLEEILIIKCSQSLGGLPAPKK